jgi:hypothetical protein
MPCLTEIERLAEKRQKSRDGSQNGAAIATPFTGELAVSAQHGFHGQQDSSG